ncbi:MAG: hypothetical protein PF572_04200 [Patescibacteria group bacterium]|jgi:hypothetical protein|nr:hypothetical protein [Patescibacteria group bacterium]
MQDITKQQKTKPFQGKEYAVNLLIANIPGSILIVFLKQFAGIIGALPTMIIIFGGAWLVGKIRAREGKRATSKTIVVWILINIIFVLIVPVLLLELL